MIQVRSGARTYEFEGTLIGHSSSKRAGLGGSDRWVEFHLFRTASGAYVISRVGFSMLYHRAECQVVQRNRLVGAPPATLSPEAVPCPQCAPERGPGPREIYPERERTWAQVCETADGVVDALTQQDQNGSKYLTRVAERLLTEAGKVDAPIDMAYRIEHVR